MRVVREKLAWAVRVKVKVRVLPPTWVGGLPAICKNPFGFPPVVCLEIMPPFGLATTRLADDNFPPTVSAGYDVGPPLSKAQVEGVSAAAARDAISALRANIMRILEVFPTCLLTRKTGSLLNANAILLLVLFLPPTPTISC